jgi:hypothetical protein
MFLEGSVLGICFNIMGLSGLHYVKVLSRKEERGKRNEKREKKKEKGNWECGFESISRASM